MFVQRLTNKNTQYFFLFVQVFNLLQKRLLHSFFFCNFIANTSIFDYIPWLTYLVLLVFSPSRTWLIITLLPFMFIRLPPRMTRLITYSFFLKLCPKNFCGMRYQATILFSWKKKYENRKPTTLIKRNEIKTQHSFRHKVKFSSNIIYLSLFDLQFYYECFIHLLK